MQFRPPSYARFTNSSSQVNRYAATRAKRISNGIRAEVRRLRPARNAQPIAWASAVEGFAAAEAGPSLRRNVLVVEPANNPPIRSFGSNLHRRDFPATMSANTQWKPKATA
jgi:hypothetical protein